MTDWVIAESVPVTDPEWVTRNDNVTAHSMQKCPGVIYLVLAGCLLAGMDYRIPAAVRSTEIGTTRTGL